jgi:hypothetical protein
MAELFQVIAAVVVSVSLVQLINEIEELLK